MDKLKELQKQLEQIEQQIVGQAQEDAIAGYGWGCSDKSWALNRTKYALIKQIQDLTNRQTYAIILTESEVNGMKHNLLYVSCPICGRQLIDLAEGNPACEANEHMYWCDGCNVDITIIESEEGE